MNYYQTLVSAIVVCIQADLLALAQNLNDCNNNNGTYTRNGAYSANLNTTLSSLSTNIGSYGFYNASSGLGIDRVNALALCRGDLQLDDCRDCVQAAVADLLQSCPNQKQAIHWDASCMLRYSNATIFGILATAPRYGLYNTQNVTSPVQFKANLRALLDNLRRQAAAGSSLWKVAAGNATGPDFQTIYGLVQCTPDLSSQDCATCLVSAISLIPKCCEGRLGGRVVRPSCNLRFEVYPFFNETRLREIDSVPSPPPPPPPPPVPTQEPPPGKKNGNRTRTIIILVAAIVVCLILAIATIIFLRKRKKQIPTKIPPMDDISTAESIQYTFSTIKAATDDFSDHNKLGQGGFWTVYKGKLQNGQEIAVKRLSKDSGKGDLEFKNEVLLLAKLQHRNLVRLLGFALEGMEKLVVYEFVENASLDHFIFDRSDLDWDRRYKIIGGIARGILYLHEDSRLRIIHRDLKASNILLDGEMSPKIANFGMARLFRQDETQGNTSRVVGTYGYMPPEYLIHGQFSIKSDVFSFGVLVLEIISGRKNSGVTSGEDLISFAWKSWQEGRGANVVDPFLQSTNEILRCIHIGLLCVQEDPADRPTMASVVLMLSSFSIALELPSVPAFYFASGYAPDVSLIQYSTNSEYNKSPQNDYSITELHPR